MRHYDQYEIDNLINCEKVIIQPPKKHFAEEDGHRSKNMQLESTDGEHRFHVFIRQNTTFIEDFSIGLRYLPLDGSGSFNLLRCNGPHRRANDFNSIDTNTIEGHRFNYHIHFAREENMISGRKAESGGDNTEEYSTFDDALAYFIRKCNIIGAEEHFDFMRQLDFGDYRGDQS